MFYWAKVYSEDLGLGEEYENLKKTICINIINFSAFECSDYHSHFKLKEVDSEIKRETEIVKNLRKIGMTEEQIKLALGNN